MRDSTNLPKLFDADQINYLRGLTKNMFVDLGYELDNVVEVLGLSDKQDKAAKLLLINTLTIYSNALVENLELVKVDSL